MSRHLIAAAMAMLTSIASAHAAPHQGSVVVHPAHAPNYQRQPAPPPPRMAHRPGARRGHIWVDGHWQWRGNRYRWVDGHWVRARSGYGYAQPQWVQRNGRWVYVHGQWQRRHKGHGQGGGRSKRYDPHPGHAHQY